MADDTHPKRDAHDEELDEALDRTGKSDENRPVPPNPPRTTTGVWTSPKFGSAGSGGAELEPGPERD